MRLASVITLTLLIQIGLIGRLVASGPCSPAAASGLSHARDHCAGSAHHRHVDCADEKQPSDGKNRPVDCGEHRQHHHGDCIHTMQLSPAGESEWKLAPLRAISLACERQNLRAPDGPVRELDKPPLI